MRAADCKPFVKKGFYPFLTVSGGAGPQAPPHIFYFPGPDDKFSVTGAKQGYTTGETCDMIDE